MIENNHPRLKEALKRLKYARHYSNKDWIAALLNELGAIEYTSCTRLKNQNGHPRKSAIVSICILLGSGPDKSAELLAAAGHTLRHGNDLDDAYCFLIEKSHREAQDGDSAASSGYGLIDKYNRILVVLVGEVKALDRLGPVKK